LKKERFALTIQRFQTQNTLKSWWDERKLLFLMKIPWS